MSSSSSALPFAISTLFGRPLDHRRNEYIPINLIKLDEDNCRSLLPWLAVTSSSSPGGITFPGYRAVVPCEEWATANTALVFRIPPSTDGCALTVHDILGDIDLNEAAPSTLLSIASSLDAHILQLGVCFGGTSFMMGQAVITSGGAPYLLEHLRALTILDRPKRPSEMPRASVVRSAPYSPCMESLHEEEGNSVIIQKCAHISFPLSSIAELSYEERESARVLVYENSFISDESEIYYTPNQSVSAGNQPPVVSTDVTLDSDEVSLGTVASPGATQESLPFLQETSGKTAMPRTDDFEATYDTLSTTSSIDDMLNMLVEFDAPADDDSIYGNFSSDQLTRTSPALIATSPPSSIMSTDASGPPTPADPHLSLLAILPTSQACVIPLPTPEPQGLTSAQTSSSALVFNGPNVQSHDNWLLGPRIETLAETTLAGGTSGSLQTSNTFGAYRSMNSMRGLEDVEFNEFARTSQPCCEITAEGDKDNKQSVGYDSSDRLQMFIRDARSRRDFENPFSAVPVPEQREVDDEDVFDRSIIIPQLEWADECVWEPSLPAPQEDSASLCVSHTSKRRRRHESLGSLQPRSYALSASQTTGKISRAIRNPSHRRDASLTSIPTLAVSESIRWKKTASSPAQRTLTSSLATVRRASVPASAHVRATPSRTKSLSPAASPPLRRAAKVGLLATTALYTSATARALSKSRLPRTPAPMKARQNKLVTSSSVRSGGEAQLTTTGGTTQERTTELNKAQPPRRTQSMVASSFKPLANMKQATRKTASRSTSPKVISSPLAPVYSRDGGGVVTGGGTRRLARWKP